MGQWETYEAIRRLGRATSRQVYEYLVATSGPCNISAVHGFISRLCRNGLVAREPVHGMRCGVWVYRVVAEYPERNVVAAAMAGTTAPAGGQFL